MTAQPTPADFRTLAQLLAWRVAASPLTEAYRHFESGAWRSVSWEQVQALVLRWRRALAAARFAPGTRAAILLPNGLNMVCIDQAVLAEGGVPVPMHAIDNAESIAYILEDSEAELLLVDGIGRWQAIAALGRALPALRQVVVAEAAVDAAADPRVVGLPEWLARGDARPLPDPAAGPGPDDLAAIVYTSGTTGRPKGVMLTHRNVVANVHQALDRFGMGTHDLLLSFLPLSHTLERTAGYYVPMAGGAAVAFARSVAQLQEDLRTVKPTALVSVPRIYERIHAKVVETSQQGSAIARKMLAWTENVGWRRFEAAQGRGRKGALDDLAWRFLQPLVAQRVLDAFGGRLRLAVSGGAPIGANVSRLFLGLGLNLVQGYGMTESSPVVSACTPQDNDPLSVGRPLKGVEVRLGEMDELLVRGDNVMKGYWKRPEDTAKVLEPDGWLHTGDRARLDGGRIYIVGRLKDIIVTSTGEKVPPADLELAIQAEPLFSQVLVIGEQRPFLSVLAVVDHARWRGLATQLGLDAQDPKALESDAVQRWAVARVAGLVKSFPSYATPKRVWLTAQPWTIDNGLMTPTLKLKRPALEKRYAQEIEGLYRRR
jgi:long-chain acyl-CoA synthetase